MTFEKGNTLGKRFKKGEVANPLGRGAGAVNVMQRVRMTQALRRRLEEVDPLTGKTRLEGIVASLEREAVLGNMKAVEMIWDRIEGKVPETHLNLSPEQAQELLVEMLTEGISSGELPPAAESEVVDVPAFEVEDASEDRG